MSKAVMISIQPKWCEFIDKFRSAEVIGNIHDNPELIRNER